MAGGATGEEAYSIAMLLCEYAERLETPPSVQIFASDIDEQAIHEAREARRHGERTVLFIDEIHRFNKAQQDALLPAVEDGTVTLIGATTENPSFEVTGALLSRTRVLVLNPLTSDDIEIILRRALADE